jgi:hydrogenase maturation protease
MTLKVLVLGMGNPILSDDGVGIVVANSLEGKLEGVDVATSAMIGLDLLDAIAGYDKVFLIDAMSTGNGIIGEVKRISREGSAGTMHLFTSHGIHFFELMEMGKSCGLNMPEIGAVYGIEIGDSVCFGNALTLELQKKITPIMDMILGDIRTACPACTGQAV